MYMCIVGNIPGIFFLNKRNKCVMSCLSNSKRPIGGQYEIIYFNIPVVCQTVPNSNKGTGWM